MILLLPISGPVTQAAVWKHKISQRIVSILFCGKCRSSSFLYCGCKVLTRTTRFADQYVWRTFPLLWQMFPWGTVLRRHMIHPEISKHENNIGAVNGAVPASQPSCTSMPSNQSRRCHYCSTIILLKGPASPLAIVFSIFSFKCGPRLAWQPAGPKMVCEMPLGNLGGQRSKLQVFRAPARRSFLPTRWRWSS